MNVAELKELAGMAEPPPEISPEIQQNLRLLIGEATELKTYPMQICKKFFSLGKIAGKYDHAGFTIKEVAAISGVHQRELVNARKLVAMYDGDDERFDDDLQRLKPRSWYHLKKLIGLDSGRKQQLKAKDIEAIKGVKMLLAEHRASPQPDMLIELSKIRDMIIKTIGFGRHIQDKNYLKYSPCACCGLEPPPGGHLLQNYKDMLSVFYPICEECAEGFADPSLETMLFLYTQYCIGLERTIDLLPE